MRPYTLTTQNEKMSRPHTPTGACRISKLHINTHRNPPPPRAVTTMRARCSQPLSNNQTPHPTTKARRQPVLSPVSHTRDEEIAGLLSQSPIVCLAIHHRKIPPKLNPVAAQRLLCTKPGATTAHGFLTAHTPTNWGCLSWCSLARRCSSRTFRYGYLVTTSSQ